MYVNVREICIRAILLKMYLGYFQVDEFIIEAVNLKALKKIRIGHDGTRAGDGWFLDKVVVRPASELHTSKLRKVQYFCFHICFAHKNL